MTVVDTHQHFWNLNRVSYPWLVPEYGPIYRTFEAPELEPQLQAVGVDKTVIVQAMDSYEDTVYMLGVGDKYDWVAGIVGWVPLLKPDEASQRLDMFKATGLFKGMRHLIHEEKDSDWVIQDTVIESLRILAAHDLRFDVVAVFPGHLKHVPTLSEKIPELKMVIDHLAKPPNDPDQYKIWQEQMRAAAQNPNVYAKVSGLNTATSDFENWTAADIKPWIDFAIEVFGVDRLMFGSDWPVAVLAGDYAKVWNETNAAVAGLSQAEKDRLFGGAAIEFYNLDV